MSHADSSDDDESSAMLEVARIVKPHGVRGDVVVDFISERSERRQVGQVFETQIGDLTILSIRPHQTKWIVDFGFSNREDAAERSGLVLLAEEIEDPEELWVHQLVGATVVDQGGVERGKVLEVHANPASDLLMLEGGAIVPLNFVIDSVVDGVINVDVPDGVTLETKALEGPPATVLLAEAEDADVLVIGKRGHGGFLGLLLGSVATQVTNHAECPVVIVPHE